MNRIVLIGNGFDLAHSLETSYKHFIDDLWRIKIENFKRTTFVEEDFQLKGLEPYNSMLPNYVNSYFELTEFIKNCSLYNSRGKVSLNYKNQFLKTISEKSISNWVDVEDEYFEELLRIIKADRNDKDKISKLNADFLSIKKYLDKYISTEFEKKEQTIASHPDIYGSIYSKFNVEDFSKVGLESFIAEVTFDLESIITETNENSSQPKSGKYEELFGTVVKLDPYNNWFLDKLSLNRLIQNHKLANETLILNRLIVCF